VLTFVEGCDFEEFSKYLAKLGQYTANGELEKLKRSLDGGFLKLIVFREDSRLVGHAIWHEATTDEHRQGDPRDEVDRNILRGFLGGKGDLVELHELWVTEENRGRGYGKRFFDFFELYIRGKGYESLIYYAFHPAALRICRERGYREAYGVEECGPYGEKETSYVFYLKLR
jgi:GNAT superfamily N-acetyltransferase